MLAERSHDVIIFKVFFFFFLAKEKNYFHIPTCPKYWSRYLTLLPLLLGNRDHDISFQCICWVWSTKTIYGKKMFWKPYSATQMQNIIRSKDHVFGPIFGIYAVNSLKTWKLRTLSLVHLALIPGTVLRKWKFHEDFLDEGINWRKEGMEILDTLAFAFDSASF